MMTNHNYVELVSNLNSDRPLAPPQNLLEVILSAIDRLATDGELIDSLIDNSFDESSALLSNKESAGGWSVDGNWRRGSHGKDRWRFSSRSWARPATLERIRP